RVLDLPFGRDLEAAADRDAVLAALGFVIPLNPATTSSKHRPCAPVTRRLRCRLPDATGMRFVRAGDSANKSGQAWVAGMSPPAARACRCITGRCRYRYRPMTPNR